jgi:acyl-coenzyme A synthetase/AMP-(fatty) acid ligase
MVPKSVIFVSSLPKTGSGKVSKREIAASVGENA